MEHLPGFRPIAPVPDEVIESFRGRVPSGIVELWEAQGYGTAVNGFIKVVDPAVYGARLAESLPGGHLIPLFATGMGDIFVWNGHNLHDLKFRYGTLKGLGSRVDGLPQMLRQQGFLDRWLERLPYEEAVAAYGPLSYHECFGYSPLLALGGRAKVENLQKVQLIEHVNLIHQLAGPIAY